MWCSLPWILSTLFVGRIYGALPAYSYIKNGSNDLIIMIVLDKTEYDIYKVTFIA